MFRKTITGFILICFVVCIYGCTSRYAAPAALLERRGVHRNMIVEKVDGEVYDFGVIHAHDEYIVACVGDSILVSIDLEDVESLRVLGFDPLKTVWYTLGVPAGIVVPLFIVHIF